jgi:hypothetical protein
VSAARVVREHSIVTAIPFKMSTDLPYIEGHIDALANTVWWTLDLKFGRLVHPQFSSHPSFLTTTIDHLQRVWDSVAFRLALTIIFTYAFHYIFAIQHPFQLALKCIVICLTAPWLYQIFIYTNFLDPLRNLPGPKVCPSLNIY